MSYESPPTFLCLTSKLYFSLISNNNIDDKTYYYLTDTNKTYLGKEPIVNIKDITEKSSNIIKIRRSNCKCCGAILPNTSNEFVTCEYCESTQNTYDIIKE